jgi:uncharacterized membrane protein YvbJ
MVYCNKCGVENPEDAKYCQGCGIELNTHPEPKIQDHKPYKNSSNEKSPLGAAALNLLIAGAGFVYIKKYAKAVLSFIIVFTMAIIGVLMGISYVLGILALIFVMAWSYDETKKYNQKLN